MNNRALSLDALRGYAILTMVLSATIVYGILPGWMYHAQVPPPDHVFNPCLPGLTWVDMVFPSFLFAMGAALPFSVGKRMRKGASKLSLALNALWRGVKLTFFAILIQHFYPYMTGGDLHSQLLAVFCFALLFPMYMRLPCEMPGWMRTAIQLAAMAVGATVMLCMSYPTDYDLNLHLHTSNIIILILANVSVFATLLFIFTANSRTVRLSILAILFGIILSADADSGSWAAWLMGATPASWLYVPAYLKYLFIVIPGSIAGEILLAHTEKMQAAPCVATPRSKAWAIAAIAIAIVVVNLVCLYARWLNLNLALNAALLIAGYATVCRGEGFCALWRELFIAGAVMMLLGLAFEPFEDGIKKDPVTFGYLFTTGGMSFMTLIFLSVVCDYFKCHRSTAFLVMSGQNPMVAYVACDLLIYPILGMCGLMQHLGFFATSPWLGFLQGVLLTSLAVLVTMFFTRIKWVWRT
ncbi:MAG: DUF5009 domain-containing protein [Bacteroidales bacterium]|nr:DUF5009 domain-containing protein [Bacteroidales bacterium]